jgi:hypothetical protein
VAQPVVVNIHKYSAAPEPVPPDGKDTFVNGAGVNAPQLDCDAAIVPPLLKFLSGVRRTDELAVQPKPLASVTVTE